MNIGNAVANMLGNFTKAARLLVEINALFPDGVPDCRDNAGELYQSQYAADLLEQLKRCFAPTKKEPA